MKMLWLTGHDIDLDQHKAKDSYNGRGWISSLEKLVLLNKDIELGMVLLSNTRRDIVQFGKTKYYTIKKEKQNKIRHYYGGYKKYNSNLYVKELLGIIEEFKPDLIHLFGVENQFAKLAGHTKIPIVTHLQGILTPCDNAFFPVGINKYSFLYPISIREWLYKNGFIFNKNLISTRAKQEAILFSKLNFFMGRTQWDANISQLFSPNSKYYHVNEVLRDIFYTKMGLWKATNNKKLHIVSTISETVYKGLDLILKTALSLKENTEIKFVWHVVGIKSNARIIRFFEKQLSINSDSVNITYKGILNEQQLCSLELSSDIYVHPSYIDNSPNSLCEAQLLGLPIIATNVGGVSSLIKNYESGILIPSNGVYELTYHIKELWNDSDLVDRLSCNAKRISKERHDKSRIMLELTNCYQIILGNKK